MNSHARLLSTLPFLLSVAACSKVEAASASRDVVPVGAAPTEKAFSIEHAATELHDASLSATRARLLTVADDAASALPLRPHIKNRSRAQWSVVEHCLELDQPKRALALVERIENWRRGLGYADLAVFCARAGRIAEAQGFATLALGIAEAGDETEQGWRKDRITIRVAQAHAIVGNLEEANALQDGVVPSELGKVETAKASVSDADSFDAHLEVVDLVAGASDFDQIRNAMETCAQLFDRYYDDVEKRERAEEKIKSLWGRLPLTVRIQLTIDLAGHAVRHGDKPAGLRLTKEGQALLDGVGWTPEDEVSFSAKLAQARFESGDEQVAFEQANRALNLYQERSEEIVDIFRAEALRPLARAFAVMGDVESSGLVYRMALEEGVHNPNSRPRAEDLTATCLSMVSHDFEPDQDTWKRINEILGRLGAPW